MTNIEYIFQHLIPTCVRSFGDNFKMWSDLMTDNYDPYVLLEDDDPFTECYNWFWVSINIDDTYPKEFLEYLHKICDEVDRGIIESVPFDVDSL